MTITDRVKHTVEHVPNVVRVANVQIQAPTENGISMYKTLKFMHMHVQSSRMIKGEQQQQQQQQNPI